MDQTLEGFPVVIEFPVKWGEMDLFNHVNNVAYFRYMESARIAYFEKSGIWTAGEEMIIGPILASTGCRFRAPINYPDTLRVGARAYDIEVDRFQTEYRIVSTAPDKTVAYGDGLIVSYDYKNNVKVDLPETWVKAISELQDGDVNDARNRR